MGESVNFAGVVALPVANRHLGTRDTRDDLIFDKGFIIFALHQVTPHRCSNILHDSSQPNVVFTLNCFQLLLKSLKKH